MPCHYVCRNNYEAKNLVKILGSIKMAKIPGSYTTHSARQLLKIQGPSFPPNCKTYFINHLKITTNLQPDHSLCLLFQIIEAISQKYNKVITIMKVLNFKDSSQASTSLPYTWRSSAATITPSTAFKLVYPSVRTRRIESVRTRKIKRT